MAQVPFLEPYQDKTPVRSNLSLPQKWARLVDRLFTCWIQALFIQSLPKQINDNTGNNQYSYCKRFVAFIPGNILYWGIDRLNG